jgi:hypothetical protein
MSQIPMATAKGPPSTSAHKISNRGSTASDPRVTFDTHPRPELPGRACRTRLRNVGANYLFEKLHTFPWAKPEFWPQSLFAFELRRCGDAGSGLMPGPVMNRVVDELVVSGFQLVREQ